MIGNFLLWLSYILHTIGIENIFEKYFSLTVAQISSGIVSSAQLWAKETGILSGTSNGIEIYILNAVASD